MARETTHGRLAPGLLDEMTRVAPPRGYERRGRADGRHCPHPCRGPLEDSPTYVARRYTYDFFGTWWSETGKPRLDLQPRIATATVPFSSGSHQMRLPGEARTSFVFTDLSVAMRKSPLMAG